MKIIRRLVLIVASLVVLIGIGVAVLYAVVDEAMLKQQIIAQVAEKTGRTLTIDGPVGLSVWPDVAVRAGGVKLSEADGKTGFAAIESLRLAVAVMPLLTGRLAAREIEVDGLDLTLIKRRDGTLNIDDLLGSEKTSKQASKQAATQVEPKPAARPATAETSQFLHVDIAALALRNARFTWQDEVAGKTTKLSALDFSTARLIADTALGTLSVDALKLALKGSSGADSFAFAIELPAIRLADKRLESRFTGALDVDSPSLPMRRLKLPLAGNLALDLAKSSADLTLDTRLDESKIALKLAVDRFTPLFFNFDLAIDQLNVDRYLVSAPAAVAPVAPVAKAEAPAGPAAPASNKDAGKIDLSALQGLNFRGKLAIGQLQARGLKVSALDARIIAAGGRLDVAPLQAKLYGGSLNGSLGVNAGSNAFSVRQNLEGINIQPLLKDLLQKESLEGRGSLSLDLTTRGATADALKRGLAGQAALDLRDGAVRGVNVAKMLRDAKAALRGRQNTSAAADGTEKTDFSELTASFRIVGGVASNDDLAMKSPFLRLGGAGDIDIGNSRIDYLAKITVVNTSTGQQGKELDDLRGITIPLRLRGPFDKPSYSLEVDKLLEEVAKAKLDEKKAELKEKASEKLKEKLGDKLKGLLGK